MSTSEDQQDTYTDLTARLAAADLGWSHEHGDPPASPDYIRWLAFQVMAFKPPLIAGVYVDDAMLDDMRDRLHGDNCGCGEWDSHSQEYVERMDETIHAVLYPLRHPVRPVPQGTEDSDYREQIAQALVPGGDQSTFGRVLDVIAPLVEQLRQARATAESISKRTDMFKQAYNRMAGHAVDRAAERDRYYLAWQSAARGRRQARQQWQTWQREAEQWQAGTVESAKATQGLRAELTAVGRAIECFLGVEYGTPVESARALVERCADAESALDGLRAERDEWFLGRQRGYSDALRGMARRATALRRDRDQVHNQCTGQRDKAVQEARGERHVRRLNELALLGQLSAEQESRFRWAEEAAEHEQGEREMANHVSALDDECADLRARLARAEEFYTDVRDLQVAAAVRGHAYHAQAQKAKGVERLARLNQGYEAFDFNVLLKQVLLRWADVAPVELTDDEAREALEDARGVATQPAESETPDEHVREHDDAAPTRTGADWCPSCRVEVGTNRYRDDDGTERCGTCGSELAESAPLADLPHEEWRAFREAVTGVDPGAEPAEPQAEPAVFQHRALVGHVGDETKRGRVMEALPDGGVRVRWDDSPYPKVHNPAVLVLIASPGAGTETGE